MPTVELRAGAVFATVATAAISAIQAGRAEQGLAALNSLRSCLSDGAAVDFWHALALIESGDAAGAIDVLDAAQPASHDLTDRLQAVRALALRTLSRGDWSEHAERVLATSSDDIARALARRVQVWS